MHCIALQLYFIDRNSKLHVTLKNVTGNDITYIYICLLQVVSPIF